MKKMLLLVVAVAGLSVIAQGVNAESGHRFGVGVNYWKMMHDIDADNFDKNGVSWVATYQYKPVALLRLEADLEVFPKGFQGSDKTAYSPGVYLVLGSGLYAAAGIGWLYADGDFADHPFYALRAGFDLEILPQIYLDLNVNYRTTAEVDLGEAVKDIDLDTITLGAALRFAL